jgi:hypothetical protein
MSYLATGALLGGATRQLATSTQQTAPQPEITATSPTTENLLPRCPSGQEYHTTLKKCVPRCPSGQSYNLYYGKCITTKVACDALQDQVYDPQTGKCFDPRTMDIPWDNPAHPFWAMQLQDRQGRWRRRGDMKHICKDYLNSPRHWPSLTRVGQGGPGQEGVWMCRTRRDPRQGTPDKTPTPLTSRCVDASCALENCQAAEAAGLIPPGHASICAQWMAQNVGTGACVTETVVDSEGGVKQVTHKTGGSCRVSDYITFLNKLSPEERVAVEQAIVNEQAAERNKKLLIYGGIGLAALAGVLLLKKKGRS